MRINALMEIAGRQHGCITRVQALQVMSRRQFERLVALDTLTRSAPGVYYVTGMPNTWHQRVMVAALSIPGSVASHRCAARLWGITAVASERVCLTTAPDRTCPRPQTKVHESCQLDGFTTTNDNIPVTDAARTLVDLAGCTTPQLLGKALDQACTLRLVTLADVQRCLDRMITNGVRGTPRMREALAMRTVNDERAESEFERQILRWVRRAGLPEPVAQHWLIAEDRRYRIDLAYPELRIAIEPDEDHHLLPSIAANDRMRDVHLAMSGWIVFHVYENMSPDDLIVPLRSVIAQRSAQQPPENHRRGG